MRCPKASLPYHTMTYSRNHHPSIISGVALAMRCESGQASVRFNELGIIFLIAIAWLQTQLWTILNNRTTNYYAYKTISFVVFGLNCFVIFNFVRFYSGRSGRFKPSNPQEELQSLAEFKTSIVNCIKELIARMKQYVGLNDHNQYCGKIGAVHYKFWGIDSDQVVTSKTTKCAIDKVLKLEDGQWLKNTFCVELKQNGKYEGHLRISSHSICAGICLPSDMQAVCDVENDTLQY